MPAAHWICCQKGDGEDSSSLHLDEVCILPVSGPRRSEAGHENDSSGDYVKSGISICIFPEGTRNTGEELSLLPFKEGSFKIAEKAGCAIVPISLNNTAQIFEAHLPFVRKTHVVVEYGKPVYPKDLDKETRKHLAPYFEAIIKETIEKNADMV